MMAPEMDHGAQTARPSEQIPRSLRERPRRNHLELQTLHRYATPQGPNSAESANVGSKGYGEVHVWC